MDQAIFWFFLLLMCHESTGEESVQNQVSAVRAECSSPNLNDRVVKLEAKYIYQEEDISFLKTTVHQLRDKVARIEAAAELLVIDELTIIINTSQGKRPARLLPSPLFFGK